MEVAPLRKNLNMTQAQFAAELGVSETYIGHIEQGLRQPSIKLATKMERVLGVDGIVASVVAKQAERAA